MSDLIAFLKARLDEDEKVAKAAVPGPWRWGDWSATFGTPELERGTLEHAPRYGPFPDIARREIETTKVLSLMDSLEIDPDQEASAHHIARHDPARALREVEAKRAVLREHYILANDDRNEAYEEFSVVPWGEKGGAGDQGSGCVTCHYYAQGGVKGYGICRTVRLLAAVYSDHPDYDPEWSPGTAPDAGESTP